MRCICPIMVCELGRSEAKNFPATLPLQFHDPSSPGAFHPGMKGWDWVSMDFPGAFDYELAHFGGMCLFIFNDF